MKWPTNSGDDFVVDVTHKSDATLHLYIWMVYEWREVANTKSKLLEVISGFQLGKFQGFLISGRTTSSLEIEVERFPKTPKTGLAVATSFPSTQVGRDLGVKSVFFWKHLGKLTILTAGTQKWRFGRWFSFSIGWFLGSMLIFQGVLGMCMVIMV